MPPSIKGAIDWMYDKIEPNSKLLDFGCSTGYFGSYIKKHKNCTVYGVEISDDINEARKVLDGVYSFDLDGNWPELVYERKYDYLFFGDVLEHVKDPRFVLEKCQKLLKKEGKIFISTPNIAHISTRLELMSGNFEYEPMGILDETHLKYFTKRSLTKLISDAGFQLEFIDYTANEYPKEVIEKLLKKSGLKPEEKFWDMTKTVEARAFQYKLVIRRKDSKNDYHLSERPFKKPEQFRDDLISDLNSQIKNIKKHADEQAKVIEHLSNAKDGLEQRIQFLEKELNSTIKYRLRSVKSRTGNTIKKKTNP